VKGQAACQRYRNFDFYRRELDNYCTRGERCLWQQRYLEIRSTRPTQRSSRFLHGL